MQPILVEKLDISVSSAYEFSWLKPYSAGLNCILSHMHTGVSLPGPVCVYEVMLRGGEEWGGEVKG